MIPLIVFVFGAFGGEKNSLLWYAIDMAPIWETPFGQKPWYNTAYMCCLASQGYPSPSFKSNIFPSGWILGSGLVSLRIYSIWGGLPCGLLLGSCGWILGSGFVSLKIYNIWGGLRCGRLLGSCGFRRCFSENLQHLRWAPVWASRGSGDVSMRIYSIWGGLRCELLWVPATFLWEFTAFCVGTGHVKDLPGKKNAGEKVPSQISR